MELFFGHDLNVEQTQKLTLSQEMIQSLNILQFSQGELFDYVYSEMMENPVIDVDEQEVYIQSAASEDSDLRNDGFEDSDFYGDGNDFAGGTEDKSWDVESWADYTSRMNYYDDNYYGRYSYDSYSGDAYEYSAVCDITLEDNLITQMELCDVSYATKAIGMYIIQSLDENGYMTCTTKEIAEELNVSEIRVKEALEVIWTFDPVGVGAMDLCECLELQLKAIDRLTEPMKIIVRNHLEDIATNRLSVIARDVGISIYKVQDCADLLRSLEPKPGRMFAASESTKYIIPDVNVENHNGSFTVMMNKATSPKVIIRNEYRRMLQESDKNSNVAVFLSDRFNTALWLIKSIEQRKETILKVTEAIVNRQQEFFLNGKQGFKPVTMKEIAEEIGIHESTVSRAVNGKYVQSAQGIFELRYFFSGSSRYVGANGEQASSESLKTMISRLVESEDRTMPLSDRSIAEAIMITGVKISRRTVAKYREELGIPSSSVRRRVK
ncbi:MAG: RNA polymerase factor sigma-54 [Firmicutes bacterium]|nr:RNA polymerase factor sigma-54 [Bacillota bacterium]